MIRLYILYFIFVNLILTTNLYAYLDPGSSGSILSVILGAIITAWGYILFKWREFKDFLKKKFKKKKS